MMGAWLFSQYFNYDHVASDKSTLIPSCLTTTVGFLLLLVGILGFIITYKANICLTRLVGLIIFRDIYADKPLNIVTKPLIVLYFISIALFSA